MKMKKIQDLKVIKNTRLNPDNYLLKLLSSEKLPKIMPGQFVEVLIENSTNTFLRRPISIHDVDYDEKTITLLIRRVGDGTKNLGYIEDGDFLNIIYPLGNSFSMPDNNDVLLIGGGVGIAPLLYFAKYLRNNNIIPTILYGGKNKDDICYPKYPPQPVQKCNAFILQKEVEK